jgi:hypothetical protein
MEVIVVGVGGVRAEFAIKIVEVALKLEADAEHVLIRDHKMEDAIICVSAGKQIMQYTEM